MRLLKILTCTAVLIGATLAGTVGYAQEEADVTFAKKAGTGGMAEVKLGQLAQEKGRSAAVKAFGKRMQRDHADANNQLERITSKNNISLPAKLDDDDQDTYERLSKLSGDDFDRAYAKDMVIDHEKDISEFKKEATDGKNPDVRQFASRTLPTLEKHLQLAKEMQKSVGTQTEAKPTQ